jgi:hypothetical protein
MVTTGIPLPIPSATNPTMYFSVMPSAHWLMVLKVAGASTATSAGGHTSGCGGSL